MQAEAMKPASLASLLETPDVSLASCVLMLAQDADPSLDPGKVLREIAALQQTLLARIPADAGATQRLQVLLAYFYGECGFAGNSDDYYRAENSYLHTLLQTRRGIPISLAILLIEVAQGIQLKLAGVGFPGHFLVRCDLADKTVIIDPFSGNLLSLEQLRNLLPEHLKDGAPITHWLVAATPAQITARMLNNLRSIHAQSGAHDKLLVVLQRMLELAPDEPVLLRDRGLAYAALDCPRAAADDLTAYLNAAPDAQDANEVRARLAALQQAARRLN
jgi:regulator of sirC expression with transglutaminase-like and TPR domain